MKSRVFQTTESEAPCIIDRLSISLALNLPLFSKLQKAEEEEAEGGGEGGFEFPFLIKTEEVGVDLPTPSRKEGWS